MKLRAGVLVVAVILGGCSQRRTSAPIEKTAQGTDRLMLSPDDMPKDFSVLPPERRPKLDVCGVDAVIAGSPVATVASVGYTRSAVGPDLAQFVLTFTSAAEADTYAIARQKAVTACERPVQSDGPVTARRLERNFGVPIVYALQLRKSSETESGDVLQDEVLLKRGPYVVIVVNQGARIINSNRTITTVEAASGRLTAYPIP